MKEQHLKILWDNTESKGWIDTIPWQNFLEKGSHSTTHAAEQHGKSYLCEVSIFNNDSVSIIDYGGSDERREANRERKIYLGQTLIFWVDDTRTIIKSILWRQEEDGEISSPEHYHSLA
jgi:hypothetical protein